MKEKFLNTSLQIIQRNSPVNNDKLEIISYGLEGIYLTLSKFIIILIISIILGIFKEVIILSIFYNIIRFVAFGMHAKKSSTCLIMSLFMFIGGVYLASYVNFPFILKIVLSLISIFILIKYAPADTEKRPIVNKKRRLIYKILSTSFGIAFSIIIIMLKNNLISNFMLIGLIEAVIMIHPLTYKFFKLPYDNYKNFTYGLSN